MPYGRKEFVMFDKIDDYIYTHIWAERIAVAITLISAVCADIFTWWIVFTCHDIGVITVIIIHRLCLTYYNCLHMTDIDEGKEAVKELFR